MTTEETKKEQSADCSHTSISDDHILDKHILDKYWKGKMQTLTRVMKSGKCLQEEVEYVTSRYDDSSSIEETLYRMKHKIEVKPTCKVCGNPLHWTAKHGYQTYCSKNCSASDPSLICKRKEGLVKKYGSDTPFTDSAVIYKRNETWMKKYGGNPLGNSEVRSHITSRPNPIKGKQTCRRKYGVDNYAMTTECKEKVKETCASRYGDFACNLQYVKEAAHSPEADKKRIATMKKNGSFTTSIPEERVYAELKKRCDVERQHTDARYPWHCDFYLPEYDMYVECNFHWTHGGHPYDPNNIEDQKKAEEWKSKHTRYYDNAVKTWTVRDVMKMETAKKNNLRYVVLYSELDAISFYIQLDNKTIDNERNKV